MHADLAADLTLSTDTRRTAGVILLTIVAIEWGGWYLLRVARGRITRTPFQAKFERAGHAHAGVLVTLAMVTLLLGDGVSMSGPVYLLARNGVPLAAILLPAGYFLAAMGKGRTRPNGFIGLIYLGMVSLAAGVVALGVSLLAST
jgi:hypothetical protein